jgi:hypothetical protein
MSAVQEVRVMTRRTGSTTMEGHLGVIPAEVRPIAVAARALVRSVAPDAEEVVYQSSAPRSRSAMWKLAHYRLGGEYVVGIGVFAHHATLWFDRGSELQSGHALLEGSGAQSRFVRLDGEAAARRPELQALVREAFGRAAA